MELQRHYHTKDEWQPIKNVPDATGTLRDPHRAPGVVLNPPPFSHITVNDTGTTPEQHFTPRFVERGQNEGWLAIQDGMLTIYAKPENLVYAIKRGPGRYSCFDHAKLPDDDKGALARAYIAERYPGQTSPDPENPAGYYMINYYDCVLDAAQHARYRIQKGQV